MADAQSFVDGHFPLWNTDLWSTTSMYHRQHSDPHQGSSLEHVPEFFARHGCCCASPRSVKKASAALCRHRQPCGGATTTEAGKWRIVDFSFVSSFPVSTLGSWQGTAFSIFANWRLGLWVLGWHGPASRVLRTRQRNNRAQDIGGQCQTDMWSLKSTISGWIYSATPLAHPGRVERLIR